MMIATCLPSLRATLVLAAATITLVGCRDDHLNNRDTIALSAGSAMRANAAVHTIDPWPAGARKTHQPTDGRKAQNAIEIYREKPKDTQKTKVKSTTVK